MPSQRRKWVQESFAKLQDPVAVYQVFEIDRRMLTGHVEKHLNSEELLKRIHNQHTQVGMGISGARCNDSASMSDITVVYS